MDHNPLAKEFPIVYPGLQNHYFEQREDKFLKRNIFKFFEILSSWSVLWISGLALVVLWASVMLTPLQGPHRTFFVFAVLGGVVPCLVLAMARLSKLESLSLALKSFFAVVFIVVVAKFEFRPGWIDFVLAALQTCLVLFFVKKNGEVELGEPKPNLILCFLFSLFSWALARKLQWWNDGLFIASETPSLQSLSFLPWLVLGVVFSLANLILFVPHLSNRFQFKQTWMKWTLGTFCALILIRASWMTQMNFVHYAPYVGPISLIRQGGYLLWNVPSIYGVLNVFLASLLPVRSPWQALYFANSAMICLGTLVAFFLILQFHKGVLGQVFAFLTTFTFLLLVPGFATFVAGPNSFPSTGPFRFLWCYLLLTTVWLIERRRLEGKNTDFLFAIGNVFWTISVFWAFESATFGSVIWLTGLVLRNIWTEDGLRFDAARLKQILRSLRLPILLLGTACFSLFCFYQVRIGQSPDWSAYREHAKAYMAGAEETPMNLQGNVWVLLMMFTSILSMFYVAFVKKSSWIWVGVPALGCCWITGSYFVQRSHENNVLNCLPLSVFSFLVALDAFRMAKLLPGRERFSAKLLLIPVLSVCAVMTFKPHSYFVRLFSMPHSSVIDEKLNVLPDEILGLMAKANITINDPIVYLDRYEVLGRNPNSNDAPQARLWLPVAPEFVFCTLPLERREIYFQRAFEHNSEGGWLLGRKTGDEMHCIADGQLVQKFYKKTQSFESEHWFLAKYEK